MKKTGFTLAEMLIAMGIVGVAAAFLAPTIAMNLPDPNKSRALHYYAAITNGTKELLENPAVYYGGVQYETRPVLGEDGNQYDILVPKRNEETGEIEQLCEGGLSCQERSHDEVVCPGASGGGKYATCLSDVLGIEGGRYRDGSTWAINGQRITITAPGRQRESSVMVFNVDNMGRVIPDPGNRLLNYWLRNPFSVNAKRDREEAGVNN